ncbi:hypothetical protein KC19_5G024200 [Ceratodon purpureus]|uniref:Uncharacterized protein n=1 Tax=Ceratodon purpureus TaxID=3225 RepID=A0A8T0HX71_CERPU|nr:hypothetical protein KC19_5G024200 [Ceratodon purpureus]
MGLLPLRREGVDVGCLCPHLHVMHAYQSENLKLYIVKKNCVFPSVRHKTLHEIYTQSSQLLGELTRDTSHREYLSIFSKSKGQSLLFVA